MEVGEPAPLQFNNFHERNTGVLRVLRTISQLTAQKAPNLNRKASPEFWSVPAEQHVSDIVVTVTTQRLPKRGVVVVVLPIRTKAASRAGIFPGECPAGDSSRLYESCGRHRSPAP